MKLRLTLASFLLAANAAFSAQDAAPAPEPTPALAPTPTPEEAEARRKHFEEHEARRNLLKEKRNAVVAQLPDVAVNPDAHPAWVREWAGEYFCGDGLGVNVRITLGPEGDIVYTWNGCMGLYDSQIAKVREVREDRLVLDLEKPADFPNGMGFMDEEIALVRWGERRYLVPMAKMQDFCNAVNDGFERRHAGMTAPARGESRVSIRGGGWLEPPEGLPEVPAEARQWLLPAPVVASVTSLSNIDVRRETGHSWAEATADVVIDAGSAQGLKPGMGLLGRTPAPRSSRVDLLDVRENESSGRLTMTVHDHEGRTSDLLRAGMEFSTVRD